MPAEVIGRAYTKQVNVHFTPAEHGRLKEVLAQHGLETSAFIRARVAEALDRLEEGKAEPRVSTLRG